MSDEDKDSEHDSPWAIDKFDWSKASELEITPPPADRGREHRHPFRDDDPPKRTPGTPAGDVDEPHEDNTFDLPDGRPIRRGLKRWFGKQLKEILGSLPEIGEPIPASFPPLSDYNNPMESAMTPILSGYWDEAGQVTRAKLGLDPADWEVHDPHLHQVIKDSAFKFCKETNETTTKDLNDALGQLREEMIKGLVETGESIPQLTKRVQAVFEGADKWRAEMIARTEASRAVHRASLTSAKESEVVERKKILLSANACPLCVDTAAKHPDGIPLDSSFASIGHNPDYSNVDITPIHPFCRCSMTYVLTPEYEQLLAEHGPPAPERFEAGSLGPEPKKRKIGKPGKKPSTPAPAAPVPVPAAPATPAASEPHVPAHLRYFFDYGEKQGHTLKLATDEDLKIKFGWTDKQIETSPAAYYPLERQIYINPRATAWQKPGTVVRENNEGGWWSFTKSTGLIDHEIGHAEHHIQAGDNGYLNAKALGPFTGALKQTVSEKVSGYASKNRLELVAEVYAGMKSGKVYGDDILKMVRDLGGALPS